MPNSNPLSYFLLVLNTFSHFLARQRSEREELSYRTFPVRKWLEMPKSLSFSFSLLLLGAPKKKGAKEIVGIVWIEYSAGI